MQRGETVNVAEVLQTFAGHFLAVRNRLLAVPSRLRMRLGYLPAEAFRKIDAEIREALIELGEGRAEAAAERAVQGGKRP